MAGSFTFFIYHKMMLTGRKRYTIMDKQERSEFYDRSKPYFKRLCSAQEIPGT